MPPLAVLVALADPTRCRIIEILHDGAQPVHVLAGYFDISRPAISRHLRVLRRARLISEKKVGRENRYALHANHLKPVQDWLAKLVPAAKPTNRPAANPRPSSETQPSISPEQAPIAAVALAPAASKPSRDHVASQMGFDF